MQSRSIIYILILFTIIASLVFFYLNESNAIMQYRPLELPCDMNKSIDCDSSSFIVLKRNTNEIGAKLAIIEFNEQGRLYDSTLKNKTLEKIRKTIKSSERKILIVAFIHGWHHNASPDSKNLKEFQKLLVRIQNEENKIFNSDSLVGMPREVLGVYLGWQGKVTENPVAEYFSFKSRKSKAIKTGRISIRNAIEELIELRNISPQNRIVLVGHSFGGAALFSAIESNLIKSISQHHDRYLLPDLSIIINPAIEAAKFENLQNLIKTKSKNFKNDQSLLLASFTSDNDNALSGAFPVAMRLSYFDKFKGFNKNDITKTAIGCYEPYSSHLLSIKESSNQYNSISNSTFNAGVNSWSNFRTNHCFDFKFDNFTLSNKLKTDCFPSPFINVKVNQNIIGDHNSIWENSFTYFIRGLIGMEFSFKK